MANFQDIREALGGPTGVLALSVPGPAGDNLRGAALELLQYIAQYNSILLESAEFDALPSEGPDWWYPNELLDRFRGLKAEALHTLVALAR